MNHPPHIEATRPGKERRTIIGVLSALFALLLVAVLGFLGLREYLRSPLTHEAQNTIGQMTHDVLVHYEETHTLCASASAPVPPSTISIMGRKYIAANDEWQVDAPRNAGFACLKFEVNQPQYYQYDYQSDGVSFMITARGDLDADGELSLFSQSGHIENGAIVLDPMKKKRPAE